MQSFYYPLLFLAPNFTEDSIEAGPFRIAKRLWQTSIFDLATLATKHRLHLPYQAMDVLLSRCNLELCITEQSSREEANAAFQSFRLALYTCGVSPFLSPFITTHSINEYSGINSRDSESLRKNLYPGMEEGLTSEADTLEAWPFELSFQCVSSEKGLRLSKGTVIHAAEKAEVWRALVAANRPLRIVEETANAAPKILPLEQSVLHIWSAMEALFPKVSTEVTFKIALYLAQLTKEGPDRLAMYDHVRALYVLRSKIAHGAARTVGMDEWKQTWELLTEACNAVIRRGCLPEEKQLIIELLS